MNLSVFRKASTLVLILEGLAGLATASLGILQQYMLRVTTRISVAIITVNRSYAFQTRYSPPVKPASLVRSHLATRTPDDTTTTTATMTKFPPTDEDMLAYLRTGPSPAEAFQGATTTPAERAEAAAMRDGSAHNATRTEREGRLPPVEIDDGTQKYVLIEIGPLKQGGNVTHLVRGNAHAEYHKDVARATVKALEQTDIPYSVLGGGRIKHDAAAGRILVYGFSYGFPWRGESRHAVAVEVLQKAYPSYTSITWTDEGY